MVGALAMPEPSIGSDVQRFKIKTVKDGNTYRFPEQETFISNGQHAGLIIVASKTDPSERARGVSLVVLETDGAEGFTRGRNLEKLGLHVANKSELFFDNIEIPPENILGGTERPRLLSDGGASALGTLGHRLWRRWHNGRGS